MNMIVGSSLILMLLAGPPVPGTTEYPGATLHSMGSGEPIRGLPMALAYFETEDSPEQVRAFYRAVFEQWGLWPSELADPAGANVVCGIDFPNKTISSVAIFASGEGALVFRAELDLGGMQQAPPEGDVNAGGQFPMLEELMMRLQTEGWGGDGNHAPE